MAPGRKRGGSCWTCRLRRKRCNSVRPICGSCQDLEIPCYSGEARPAWMDSGAGQKHMSETIKERIKQKAIGRRERRLLTHEGHDIVITTDSDRISLTDDVVENPTPSDSLGSTLSMSSTIPTSLRSSTTDRSHELQHSFMTGSSTSSPATVPNLNSLSPAIPIQVQLGSVMIYLDYVFPFLFPFYHPSLIETGRQWLLGLLCQNEVSFHIAAGLSAYFFSLVPQNDEQDIHEDCKTLVRYRLLEQIDLAVTSIQSTVSAINRRGTESLLLDKTRIMEEITQLLIVEVTVRRNVDWTIHLTPALTIFAEIFNSHGIDYLEPSLAVVLKALPSSLPVATPHNKPLPNTADQTALVFFVSLLLFIDIVASISLGGRPTLQSYHQPLLSSHGEEKCSIQLEAVVGCQNWALVAIGNISALCAWKRDSKQNGNFTVADLINLAEPISQALEEGLASLDINATLLPSNKMNASRLEAYYSRHDPAIDYNSIANITRIWAYAAKIYLSASLSGWQSNSIDTQASLTKILSILQTIESPPQLRSLSWPICVAGCLALPNQEHHFRRIVGVMGELGEFGTISTGLRIMEAVWSSRDTIDESDWDIASSLSILGSPALLI